MDEQTQEIVNRQLGLEIALNFAIGAILRANPSAAEILTAASAGLTLDGDTEAVRAIQHHATRHLQTWLTPHQAAGQSG